MNKAAKERKSKSGTSSRDRVDVKPEDDAKEGSGVEKERTGRDEPVCLRKRPRDIDMSVTGLQEHPDALGRSNVALDGPDALVRVKLFKLLAVLLRRLERGRHLDRRVVLGRGDVA